MKDFWILFDGSKKDREFIKSLSEADAIVSESLSKKDVENLVGAKKTVASSSSDSDIQLIHDLAALPKDAKNRKTAAIIMEIRSAKDEALVSEAVSQEVDYVIIRCPDWKVIPLENIISKTKQKSKVLMEVSDHKQAKVALETLELGSDGVVLHSASPEEVMRTAELFHDQATGLDLVEVKVTGKKEIGLGARACVDTIDLMVPGEGLLVGCQSNALFLVQAEVQENPHIASRPFRVNAGSVSHYILSNQEGTNYLSELEAGHPTLIVGRDGKTRQSYVGRVKIERRPLVLVEAQWEDRKIKTILQNAETIRLVTKDGSKSIAELEPGCLVLARVERGGRHFGTLVAEESILER